jgi:hypothetical protein
MHQFNLPIDALIQEVRLISSPHFQRVNLTIGTPFQNLPS